MIDRFLAFSFVIYRIAKISMVMKEIYYGALIFLLHQNDLYHVRNGRIHIILLISSSKCWFRNKGNLMCHNKFLIPSQYLKDKNLRFDVTAALKIRYLSYAKTSSEPKQLYCVEMRCTSHLGCANCWKTHFISSTFACRWLCRITFSASIWTK